MTPSETVAARKAAQESEAMERAGVQGGNPNDIQRLNAEALSVDTDTDPVFEPPQTGVNVDEPAPIKPQVRSPKDDIRAKIADNFRRDRAQQIADEQDDVSEIRALSRNGLPPEFQDYVVQGEETVDEPPAREKPEAPPQKRKVVVRGEERFLTDEELLAAAQKGLAGDDYLGEARATLDAVKAAQKEIEAMRAASGKHPAEQNAPQDGVIESETDGEHPADPYEQIVEKLQYGDPKEAAAELRKLISTTVPVMSKEEMAKQKRADEHERSMRLLAEFQDANPDLAKDPMAQAAIRSKLHDLQREDLIKAGVDPANIPADPNVIANAHLEFRARGAKVRPVTDLLETAKSDFEKWRGRSKTDGDTEQRGPQQTSPRPTAQRQAPVQVNVDRTERRQVIPQQPTRTAVFRPESQTTTAPRDRSAVVANMRASRLAPRSGRPA